MKAYLKPETEVHDFSMCEAMMQGSLHTTQTEAIDEAAYFDTREEGIFSFDDFD